LLKYDSFEAFIHIFHTVRINPAITKHNYKIKLEIKQFNYNYSKL